MIPGLLLCDSRARILVVFDRVCLGLSKPPHNEKQLQNVRTVYTFSIRPLCRFLKQARLNSQIRKIYFTKRWRLYARNAVFLMTFVPAVNWRKKKQELWSALRPGDFLKLPP